MNIETIKNELKSLSDDDLQAKYDLYCELESIDINTVVMTELMAQELDNRGE
jgi:hypothetical protein